MSVRQRGILSFLPPWYDSWGTSAPHSHPEPLRALLSAVRGRCSVTRSLMQTGVWEETGVRGTISPPAALPKRVCIARIVPPIEK